MLTLVYTGVQQVKLSAPKNFIVISVKHYTKAFFMYNFKLKQNKKQIKKRFIKNISQFDTTYQQHAKLTIDDFIQNDFSH